MKNIFLKAAATVALSLSTVAAWASVVGGNGATYTPVQTSGQYTAFISYHGSMTPKVTQNMASNGALLSQFANTLNNAYQAVPNTITNALTPYAAQQGATLNSVVQDGSITASLTGGAGANVQAQLSGLSWYMFFTAQKSYSILHVNCTVNISIMNVTLTSNYNTVTGAVTGSNATYTPTQVTNCDNSLGWIPFVGDFINNKAQNLIGSSIQNALNAYNGQVIPVKSQTAIFGFTNAIQAGEFMAGTTDVGMYVKNNLPNLLNGKSVNVYIASPNKYFPAGTYKTPGPASTTAPVFIITMADGSSSITFEVDATGYYSWELTDT